MLGLARVSDINQKFVDGHSKLVESGNAIRLEPLQDNPSSSVDRIPLIRSEKLMLNLDPEMEFYCCHNFSNGARWNDWYENEDHYKLVFSADEGTEATG